MHEGANCADDSDCRQNNVRALVIGVFSEKDGILPTILGCRTMGWNLNLLRSIFIANHTGLCSFINKCALSSISLWGLPSL
jgi:hypothetical protein